MSHLVVMVTHCVTKSYFLLVNDAPYMGHINSTCMLARVVRMRDPHKDSIIITHIGWLNETLSTIFK